MEKMKKYTETVFKIDSHTEAEKAALEQLSRKDIIEHPHARYTIRMVKGDTGWCIFKDDYQLTVLGPRIFWKKISSQNLTFKNGRLYGSISSFIVVLMNNCENLQWLRQHDSWVLNLLAERKDMWNLVLSGKVTNPKDLARKFSKKYFRGELYASSVEKYFSSNSARQFPLWHMWYYTTNINLMIDKLYNTPNGVHCSDDDWAYIATLRDTFRYCEFLNTKVNPQWTIGRLQEEHQKQIEAIGFEEAGKYSDKPIAEAFEREGLSLVLNERACFIEGYKMHNCVHSCYWKRIKNGNYLLARGIVCGQYIDLGIQVDRYYEGVELEQVHTIRNGRASRETQDFCDVWIEKYSSELLDTAIEAHNKAAKNSDKELLENPEEEIDLPF